MFKEIILYTNQLKVLKRFYQNVLELPAFEASDSEFSLQIGTTKLTFKTSTDKARYHFAINIPGNYFTIIKEKIKQRVPLRYYLALDEVYREEFAADSFYIEDPAGNLVEFIARRNKDFIGELTDEALFNIGEIGLVTDNQVEISEALQDANLALHFKAQIDSEKLNHFGEGDSFIVLTPRGYRWDYASEDAEVFPLEIKTNDLSLTYAENKLKIKTNH